MKNLILLFFFTLLSENFDAQNWQSIPKSQSFIVNPRQFTINSYTNQMWFVSDMLASMLDTDGSKREFSNELQGNLFAGNELTFTFTPQHTYFSENVNGLYSFDNYVKNLEFAHADFRTIKSDNDTIYIVRSGTNAGFYKFCSGNITGTNKTVTNLAVKNSFIYCDIGVLAEISGPNNTDWNILYNDPQYMSGAHNEFKFSRLTDTLFVCGKKGISYAYNYDFLDSIAPNNSVDMPARNVLEIEFDHLDRLWAVFGNASNKAFALARYDNGTWVEKYDSTNCPINFATYKGFEIDTLGNIWVVDNYNLHTLLTPNSPQWLSTIELNPEISVDVYPNPSSGMVTISSSQNLESIKVYDCMGRLVYSEKTPNSKSNEINLSFLKSGNYLIESISGNLISREKFVLMN